MRTSLRRHHEERTWTRGSPERELDGGDVSQVGSGLCAQERLLRSSKNNPLWYFVTADKGGQKVAKIICDSLKILRQIYYSRRCILFPFEN